MYVYSPDGELSPGDIIKSVRLVERTANADSETLRTVPANIIVLSQGCEIDKVAKHGKSGSLVVAAVFALGSLDRGLQGLMRKNAVLKSFYPGQAHLNSIQRVTTILNDERGGSFSLQKSLLQLVAYPSNRSRFFGYSVG